MPSASTPVFIASEAVALAALTASLTSILSNKDTNQAGLQATQLAAAISVYLKAAMTAPLATIDVSP